MSHRKTAFIANNQNQISDEKTTEIVIPEGSQIVIPEGSQNDSPIYKPLIPGFLFFKMDDVELIRKALEEYKPGFDDVNYRIIDLIERIDKRVEQLKKNQSGFEDA